MELKLSAENEQVRRLARDFAQAEIKPLVMKYDEAQEFPFEIMHRIGELGFMGVTIPEKYGGAGLSYVDYCSIIEEISKVRSVHWIVGSRAQRPLYQSHLQFCARRTQTKIFARFNFRQKDRGLGID